MTPAERRARHNDVQEILDRVAQAFRRTAEMIDATSDGLERAGRALRDATQAQREALDGMLAANAAARALYHDVEDTQHHD